MTNNCKYTYRNHVYVVAALSMLNFLLSRSRFTVLAMGLPDSEGNTPTGKPVKPGRPGGLQKTKGTH
jgi:hypothetical protein